MAIRPDGRWEGRLTSRPLPLDDPSIDALDGAARDALARHWLARAASERRVADAFVVVRDALAAQGGDGELVALADRAVDDEIRHTELARVVASRFAGRELAPPPLLPLVVPAHREASDALRRSLHVVGHCAMNETIASAVLEAALAEATAPLARAALRELLSDEIDHARIGWAHLAALPAETRAALGPWLLPIARANAREWRAANREVPTDESLVAHGAVTRPLVERALRVALESLVVPGLAHVGLAHEAVARWVAEGAPTD